MLSKANHWVASFTGTGVGAGCVGRKVVHAGWGVLGEKLSAPGWAMQGILMKKEVLATLPDLMSLR